MKLRRAIFLYIGAIVLPVCGFVWLGVESFERQRQALNTLRAEKMAAELADRERVAAEDALRSRKGAIARHFFRFENGVLMRPALSSPFPVRTPPEFQDAQRYEDSHQYEQALAAFRKLRSGNHAALALQGVARNLARLGRDAESRAAWKALAVEHTDERDPSHRPYGIVAAIAAGETAGLYEKIASGRWDIPGDQAYYFLTELDSNRETEYLEQFRFARELEERFRPQGTPSLERASSYQLGDYRLYYRAAGPEVIEGLAVDEHWVRDSLRPQLEQEIGGTLSTRQEMAVYGAAIALVFVVLSAGVALLVRDVTREARTNRLRTDFVSGVSHELKTPITLIRLYGDTLMERQLSESERHDFYRIIVRESERLTRLVNQVLTFSRVERDVEQYSMETGDLAPVLSHLLDDYSEYMELAGFKLDREILDASPVRFDATAVLQAAANLLENAVKYSGESREISARLFTRERTVVFEVEDHGIGIALAEQQKIFERFYRVANGSGKGGYGLGLFLVRHIMQAHGGRVEVESEVGHGSRFRLVFPALTS